MERRHQVGRHQNQLIFCALLPAGFADHRHPFFFVLRDELRRSDPVAHALLDGNGRNVSLI